MAKRPNIKTLQMQDTIDRQAREIGRLREALKDIENPMRRIERDVKAKQAEGYIIDGHYASIMCESANYLKVIAADALKSN